MKKYISLLMALVLCVSLSGCFDLGSMLPGAGNEYEEYEELFDLLEDEEYEAAHAYIDRLEKKASRGEKEEATAALPTEAPAMEPEMPAEAEPPVEEMPAVSAGQQLTAIEVVTKDNLGNTSSGSVDDQFFNYDSKGRISTTDSAELQEFYGYEFGTWVPHFVFEYDATDVVTKITVMEHDTVVALLTPNYDAQGYLTSTDITTNTGKFTVHFTYDSNGNRLTGERFDAWYETIETFAYTYDSNGRLIQCVHNDETPWNYIITTVYTYDENGFLSKTCETWHQNIFDQKTWHIATRYTCDESGRILSAVITSDEDGCSYAEKLVTYCYGN